jgi:hypothetical protein
MGPGAGNMPHALRSASSRYELKYLVPDSLARAIARAARTWYELDPHLAPGQTEYVITSLYFDTPRMDFYEDRVCQRYDRIKARVRTYGPRNEGPVFLEIKRRFGDTMVKSRVRVPTDRWTEVLDPGSLDLSTWGLTPAGEAMARDFAGLCAGRSLRPVVSVRYDREAYIGRMSEDLRLTFDRRLRFARMRDPVLPASDRDYRLMDSGPVFLGTQSLVVLEVKFTGRHPLWLEELLAQFDLFRLSFSKYMGAVDTWQNDAWIDCPGARRSRFV